MSDEQITRILRALRDGKEEALEALLPLVYDELHAMAHRRLAAGGRDVMLDTTALVHEAYLKLFDREAPDLQSRRHFFAVATVAMRHIVVDHARRRAAVKRGGDLERADLDADDLAAETQAEEILALNDALSRLALVDERLAQVAEHRYFGGYSVEETAMVMGLSDRTVKREWRKARALLFREITGKRAS